MDVKGSVHTYIKRSGVYKDVKKASVHMDIKKLVFTRIRRKLVVFTRLFFEWSTLWVHGVEKNLVLIFFIGTTSILVSK